MMYIENYALYNNNAEIAHSKNTYIVYSEPKICIVS